MQVDFAQVKAGAPEVSEAIASARSARNLTTRKRAEERSDENARRRRKRLSDRDAEAAMKRRVRIRVQESDRPRRRKSPRSLYNRTAEKLLAGVWGSTDARGPDRRYSVHFGFVARGFASTAGRRWRAGEAERAALYIVREDALEGGELGWWSTIAQDRNELAAFHRTLEAVERHDRANANVYVTEVISLPAELSASERRHVVKRICRGLDKLGVAYTVALHLPDKSGDQRNFHVHIVYSTRPAVRVGPYEWDFAAAKLTSINTPEGILARRHHVVRVINAALRIAQIDKRYTARSNKARGMDRPVSPKHGQIGTWIERRLVSAEQRQQHLAELHATLGQLRSEIGHAASRLGAAHKLLVRRLLTTSMEMGQAEDMVADLTVVGKTVRAKLQGQAVAARGAGESVVGAIRLARTKAIAALSALVTRPDLKMSAESLARQAVGRALEEQTQRLSASRGAVIDTMSHVHGKVRDRLFSATGTASSDQAPRLLVLPRDQLRHALGRRRDTILAAQHGHQQRLAAASLHIASAATGHIPPAHNEQPKTEDVPIKPDSNGAASAPVLSAMQIARQAAETAQAALRAKALEKLAKSLAKVTRDADGRYSVDLNGLGEPERRALTKPAFDVQLQRVLHTMFEAARGKEMASAPAQLAPPSSPKAGGVLAQAAGMTEASGPARPKGPRTGGLGHDVGKSVPER